MTGSFLPLALRNVFRHRARSVATLAAIGIGVAAMILAGGFVQDMYVQLGEAIIHSQTGHLQVARKGFREGRIAAPERYLIVEPNRLKAAIKQLAQGIQGSSTRLGFTGLLNNGRRDLGIVGEGVESDSETNQTYMQFSLGRPITDADTDGIVVGQGVAKSLGLTVGDRVTLVMTLAQGAVNTLDFEVIGVFQSFSKEFDSRAVQITLEAARLLMDTPAAHIIVLMLDRTEDTKSTLATLRIHLGQKGYEITSWNELSDFYEKTVELYDRQFGVLRLIILIMVVLSVVNSINMSLYERTREFGTMRALGSRAEMIFRLIMAESICLGFIGAMFGMAIGCLAALVISAFGIPMPPPPNANLGYTAQIRIDTGLVLLAGLVGFAAAVLASVLPARRAAGMSVVDALRHGV